MTYTDQVLIKSADWWDKYKGELLTGGAGALLGGLAGGVLAGTDPEDTPGLKLWKRIKTALVGGTLGGVGGAGSAHVIKQLGLDDKAIKLKDSIVNTITGKTPKQNPKSAPKKGIFLSIKDFTTEQAEIPALASGAGALQGIYSGIKNADKELEATAKHNEERASAKSKELTEALNKQEGINRLDNLIDKNTNSKKELEKKILDILNKQTLNNNKGFELKKLINLLRSDFKEVDKRIKDYDASMKDPAMRQLIMSDPLIQQLYLDDQQKKQDLLTTRKQQNLELKKLDATTKLLTADRNTTIKNRDAIDELIGIHNKLKAELLRHSGDGVSFNPEILEAEKTRRMYDLRALKARSELAKNPVARIGKFTGKRAISRAAGAGAAGVGVNALISIIRALTSGDKNKK